MPEYPRAEGIALRQVRQCLGDSLDGPAQIEFLLADTSSTSISKQLQTYIQGTEDAKERMLSGAGPAKPDTGADAQTQPVVQSTTGKCERSRVGVM